MHCILEPVLPDLAGPCAETQREPRENEEEAQTSMSSTDCSTVALNAEGYLEPSSNEHVETHNFKGIKDM